MTLVEPRLLERLRRAGRAVRWEGSGPDGGGRFAELHQERARVEERRAALGRELTVEAGPVGALVLLLEVDRTGRLPLLEVLGAGREPRFPDGALRATWDGIAREEEAASATWREVVELARYAAL